VPNLSLNIPSSLQRQRLFSTFCCQAFCSATEKYLEQALATAWTRAGAGAGSRMNLSVKASNDNGYSSTTSGDRSRQGKNEAQRQNPPSLRAATELCHISLGSESVAGLGSSLRIGGQPTVTSGYNAETMRAVDEAEQCKAAL
jgi:hypothetical protein